MSGGETAWMLSYSHVEQAADIILLHRQSLKNLRAEAIGRQCLILTSCAAKKWQKKSIIFI